MAVPFVGCFTSDAAVPLAFIGLPDDSQSSYRRGCAQGPSRIRAAYDGDCYNACTELELDLSGRVFDAGDLPSQPSFENTATSYRETVAQLLTSGKAVFCAGGDHAVTVPVIAAVEVLREPVHIVQIDAHPDLYDTYEDS